MKFKWTENDTAKVITYSLTLIIAVLFFFLVQNIGAIFGAVKTFFNILTPFFIGFAIAYLLARPVNALNGFLDCHFLKKCRKQHEINRGISIAVSMTLALSLLTLIIYSIIPQLLISLSTLAQNADGYVKSISTVLNNLSAHFNLDADILTDILGSSSELFKKLTKYVAAGLPKFVDFSVSVGSGIYNFFIGFIISIYMLSSKEKFAAQIKKCLFAIFPDKFVRETLSTFAFLHETFAKYLSGQLLDCAILGVICFILMSILGMEYALLISMIILITNFIPVIGPFIGAVPSAFILLMVQPSKVILFIVMIIVLQQLDGNVLVPRIVGKTTGLSSFWVIFSILVGGGLFGVLGVILAVPTFSIIYAFAKRFIDKRLLKKGLSDIE